MTSPRVYGTVGFKKKAVIEARDGLRLGDRVRWYPSRTVRFYDNGKMFTEAWVPGVIVAFCSKSKIRLNVQLPDGSPRTVITPDENIQKEKP